MRPGGALPDATADLRLNRKGPPRAYNTFWAFGLQHRASSCDRLQGARLMARIRSVHPSLFTDDDFMELSSNAKVLLIGLWTEAADDGVFAWKPNGIKARILPAENCDIVALLGELEAVDFIRAYEYGGKRYAAIRNFRMFQRPQKPNSSGALPDDMRAYVGLGPAEDAPVADEYATGTLPVEERYDTGTQIAQQMEDGGWKKEEKEGREEEEGKGKAPRGERATVVSILSEVVDESRCAALIAHRQKLKAALTPHTAKLLANSLAKAPDPNAAADEQMLRGWKAWKPEWSDLTKGHSPPPAAKAWPETTGQRMLREAMEQEARQDGNAF